MNWAGFLIYVFVTAYTPGPNNLSAMANAARAGFKSGLRYVFGLIFCFLILSTACTAFCSVLSTLVPKIKAPMIVIGALYILWLAWKQFKSPPPDGDGNGESSTFWQGVFFQLLNVKAYLYVIMSMEAYVLPHYNGKPLILFGFALILTIFAGTSNILWAAFGSVFKGLFIKHTKLINTILALLLVYCAVSLFL